MFSRRAIAALVPILAFAALAPIRASATADSPASSALTAEARAQLQRLAPADPWAGIVAFDEGTTEAEMRDIATANGLAIANAWPAASGALVTGTAQGFTALAADESVEHVDINPRIELANTTSSGGNPAFWSTNVRTVQEPVAGGPYYDAAGNILDGRGIGVAVVDSGINAAHPDLTNRIAKNFKVVCTTANVEADGYCFGPSAVVPAPDSDLTNGHGTMVAGILAGEGTMSRGEYAFGPTPYSGAAFTGTAPAATLYGFGIGEADVLSAGFEAHSYILEHFDEFSPRIRVVNNSWVSQMSPGIAEIGTRLHEALVAKGVVVVYAAGNAGGFGTDDSTSPQCDDPTPGVICVANYHDTASGRWQDDSTGTRDGTMNRLSSRGLIGAPETYPDISAPGTNIPAPCVTFAQPLCPFVTAGYAPWALAENTNPWTAYSPWYLRLSGTSFAAPHLSGAVAMLLQAHPALTPAHVEDVLLDTAYPFEFETPYEDDPQNPGGRTSFEKGAGLLDVRAALDTLGTRHGRVAKPLDGFVVAADLPGDSANAALDITQVDVSEVTTRNGLALRYAIRTLVPQAAAAGSITIEQIVKGRIWRTTVNLSLSGPIPAPTGATGDAPASAAGVDGDTVWVEIPIARIGHPAPTDPIHHVRVTTGVDAAPGNAAALDPDVAPTYGRPFSIGALA